MMSADVIGLTDSASLHGPETHESDKGSPIVRAELVEHDAARVEAEDGRRGGHAEGRDDDGNDAPAAVLRVDGRVSSRLSETRCRSPPSQGQDLERANNWRRHVRWILGCGSSLVYGSDLARGPT